MFTKHALMMAAAFGVVAMAGCNRKADSDKGSAVVSVHQALAISDISNMSVAVTGAGIGGTPLVVPLVKNGNQYSAVISSLPVGIDYTFSATAKDAAAVVLYQGSVSNQVIQKNKTANIVINMNQVAAANPLFNSAPVIDSISASSLLVTQGEVVALSATAHDPDLGQTAMMTFGWTSTCGVLGTVTTVAGTDTVPGSSSLSWTAPAVDGPCAINLTVTDMNGVLKNVASLTINVNDSTGKGNAKVTALPNTYPVIAGLNATPVPLYVGVATTLTVDATDADGDALNYLWSTPCAGTFSAANAASTTFTLTDIAATSCDMTVVVNDGLFPNGAAKGSIANHLVLPVAGPAVAVAGTPVFGFDYQTMDTIKANDVVGMAIIATQGCTGGTLSFNWSATPGTVQPVVVTPASLGLDTSFTTAASYTAGVGAEDGPVVTVTVTATCSLAGTVPATHDFTLAPANSFCATQPDGTNCLATLGGNQCVTAATCLANACVVTAEVFCSASTVSCQVNACVPSTGLCALAPAEIGTACSDGLLCTTGDICNAAGECIASPVVCAAPANVCLAATCAPSTGLCVDAPVANGNPCSDNNGCTGTIADPDSCQAGICDPGAPYVCGSGLMCVNGPAPAFNPDCVEIECLMSSAAVKVIPPLVDHAAGADGAVWATGNLFSLAPGYDFGNGVPVITTGSSDIYLTKVNPATGLATLAFGFGDPDGKDQFATAVGVASNGNVGLIGNFEGAISFTGLSEGTEPAGVLTVDYLANSAPIEFWALFNSLGAPIKSKRVDVGGGSIYAIGTNPTQSDFVICGRANKLVPAHTTATGLLRVATGGTYTNTYGTGYDIVVAKIDQTGTVVWGRQIGGAGNQSCSSVTIDNNGDVVLTGTFNGALDFGGTTTALTPPVVHATNAVLYAAKLNGTNGQAISAKSWGLTGVQLPKSLTVDNDNNILLAGAISTNIDFGGGVTVTNAGLTDVLVVKFDPALGVTWAKSYGDAVYNQQAYSVATTSSGDVVVAGLYQGSLGALGLTSASSTNSDGFVATLAAADGSATCTKSYGDAAGGQEIDSITVARTATGALANSVMMSGLYASSITFGTTTLTTGGPGIAASFISRATP